MINFIKRLIQNRIDAEMENIMKVCIDAGNDIDCAIEEALKL